MRPAGRIQEMITIELIFDRAMIIMRNEPTNEALRLALEQAKRHEAGLSRDTAKHHLSVLRLSRYTWIGKDDVALRREIDAFCGRIS